jgi:hypothetical protein
MGPAQAGSRAASSAAAKPGARGSLFSTLLQPGPLGQRPQPLPLFFPPFQIRDHTMELLDELSVLWIEQTGFQQAPFSETLQTWIESTGRISDVHTAIRITGRKVRLMAGTELEFNIATACAFCRNAVRRIKQERIAKEYQRRVTQ